MAPGSKERAGEPALPSADPSQGGQGGGRDDMPDPDACFWEAVRTGVQWSTPTLVAVSLGLLHLRRTGNPFYRTWLSGAGASWILSATTGIAFTAGAATAHLRCVRPKAFDEHGNMTKTW